MSSTDWLAQWWEITYQNEESSHKVRPVGSETTKDADSSAMYPGKFKKMLSQKDRSNRSAVPKGQQVFLRGNLVILRSCRKLKLELTREVRRQVKDVRTALHENILRYVGAILGPDGTAVLYEFCAKGTLQVNQANVNTSTLRSIQSYGRCAIESLLPLLAHSSFIRNALHNVFHR